MKRSIWENLIPFNCLPPQKNYPHVPTPPPPVPRTLPPPPPNVPTPLPPTPPPTSTPPATHLPPPHLPTPPTHHHLPAPNLPTPPPPPTTYPHPWTKKMLTLFIFYWSTIFVISSVFFRNSNFVQIRVEIILHDDSSRFRYSTGYVFMQNFRLTILIFSVTSTPLTFCFSRDLNFSLNHNFKQLNSIGSNLIL